MIPGVGHRAVPGHGAGNARKSGGFPAILKSGFWHAEIEPGDIIRGEGQPRRVVAPC